MIAKHQSYNVSQSQPTCLIVGHCTQCSQKEGKITIMITSSTTLLCCFVRQCPTLKPEMYDRHRQVNSQPDRRIRYL